MTSRPSPDISELWSLCRQRWARGCPHFLGCTECVVMSMLSTDPRNPCRELWAPRLSLQLPPGPIVLHVWFFTLNISPSMCVLEGNHISNLPGPCESQYFTFMGNCPLCISVPPSYAQTRSGIPHPDTENCWVACKLRATVLASWRRPQWQFRSLNPQPATFRR